MHRRKLSPINKYCGRGLKNSDHHFFRFLTVLFTTNTVTTTRATAGSTRWWNSGGLTMQVWVTTQPDSWIVQILLS